MDQTLCKVQMYDRLDKIQESEDPRAEVEAYFNRTGKPCKTFCRIRSADKRFDKISDIFDAPIYTTCGNERYCTEGGKCKKIGSVIKVDKQSKKVEDTLKKSNSTRKGKGDGGENGDGDGGYGDLDNRTLQTTESRALLKLLLKLPSYLGSGLGSGSSAILESIPLEKLSVVLNKINKIRICQLENVQNPSITALPGQDPTSPCRVFCKEELGGSTRGIKNVRYFVALVPDLTPCLIGDSILPLGTCTAGVCVTTAVAGGAAAFTGTGVLAPVAGTGAVAGGTVAALSANDKSVASPKNNSTKI